VTVVLGLDLSSTRTGICANGEVASYTPPKGPLLERARATASHIREWAVTADLIVIEAIGTRMINTAIALATVHAITLDRIDGCCPIQMVAPADLKKFATGRGNADKDTVMLAAAKLEPAIANNDEADSWWLWAIGCGLVDRVTLPGAYRQAVVDKLRAAA
jgi:Holliday junction resolvasome RuvABC endonuclease subunit